MGPEDDDDVELDSVEDPGFDDADYWDKATTSDDDD
jgi:hypothetical protein